MFKLFTEIDNVQILNNAIERYREKKIILPTFKQLKNPELIPEKIKDKLKNIGLWEVNPLNLFRITWKNEPKEYGGGFSKVNYIVLPRELTGVNAKIVVLIGKWFPTGAHKVGAAYGCLVPKIVTGNFDPTTQKAVWPSTGNFCRGGAYVSKLMETYSVAILPEGMSKERFEWLKNIASEVIATPGSESNVKEIYDKVWEIKRTRPDCVIFNQFEEFGNSAWHYHITGSAIEQTFNELKNNNSNLAAFVSATGSAGTIAAGDYLKKVFPSLKIVASEALQCPTLLQNGFGTHRIEGIGDKHVPWIHNVRNTDFIVAIDDLEPLRLLRLFNETEGKKLLEQNGIDKELVNNLEFFGISGIANILASIKIAKYLELTEDDYIFTISTDSAQMYISRIIELREQFGTYSLINAEKDFDSCLLNQKIDNILELTYYDKKRIHNLKYFTWIEQQAKDVEDLNALWYDRNIWDKIYNQVYRWDELIDNFNKQTKVFENI